MTFSSADLYRTVHRFAGTDDNSPGFGGKAKGPGKVPEKCAKSGARSGAGRRADPGTL
jgi:hypothetical protein